MTRFARAKGSKASNERVPEAATPWSEMKKQLVEKKHENEEVKKRQEADEKRKKNYKQFLEEVEKDKTKNLEWAEFPNQIGKKKAKKRKVVESEKDEKQNKIEVESKKNLEKSSKEVSQVTLECVSGDGEIQKTPKKKRRKLKKSTKIINQVVLEENQSNEEQTKSETDIKPKKRKKKLKKNTTETNQVATQPLPVKEKTEEDLKKLEKKQQKKLRQLEKRKLKTSFPVGKKKYPSSEKPERRKKFQDSMIINGEEVKIAYIDGFPIKKEDAERIHQLRRQMISKGLPRSEIKIALKLERRKAEKAFAREKKKVCFNCRKSGHNLSECPELGKEIVANSGTGICFKCGSTEHTHFECKVVRGQEFKFAQCFICQEQGHIARQCPDNARGLYPKGGACRVCGDVTHLKKDCPKYQLQQQQLQDNLRIDTIDGAENPDVLESGDDFNHNKSATRINKVIKF